MFAVNRKKIKHNTAMQFFVVNLTIRHFFDQIIPFTNSNLTVTTELSYVSGLGNSRTTQYENMNRKVTRDVTPKNTTARARIIARARMRFETFQSNYIIIARAF